MVTIVTDNSRRSVMVTGRRLIRIATLLSIVRVRALTNGIVVRTSNYPWRTLSCSC